MALIKCPDCSKEVSDAAPTCPQCGRPMRAVSPPVAAVAPPIANTQSSDALTRLFVGDKSEYYATQWKSVERASNKNTWNWAAFFFTLGWMAYRKMYAYSWIFIGLVAVELLCQEIFLYPEWMSNALDMSALAICGWQGNRLYQLHVAKKLREISPTGETNERVRMRLTKEGGTSSGAAVGFIIALLVVVFGVGLIVLGVHAAIDSAGKPG